MCYTRIMEIMLASISASGLVGVLLQVIVIGLVCGLLWWLVSYVALPEPFNKLARVIIAIVAVVFLINALLSIVGRPFIVW